MRTGMVYSVKTYAKAIVVSVSILYALGNKPVRWLSYMRDFNS